MFNQSGPIDATMDTGYKIDALSPEAIQSVADYFDGKTISFERISGLELYKRDEVCSIIAMLGRERPNGEYISISDLLINRSHSGSRILASMDIQYKCNRGIAAPSRLGLYRLRPRRQFAVDIDGKSTFEYSPGDEVRWKQQLYTRVPSGLNKGQGRKKLDQSQIQDLARRGMAHRVFDYGKAIVDEFGLISVSYQDACQLLGNNGFLSREEFGETREIAICSKQQFNRKQLRHETKLNEVRIQTRNNWLWEEIPPWEEKKIRKRLESKTDLDTNKTQNNGKQNERKHR